MIYGNFNGLIDFSWYFMGHFQNQWVLKPWGFGMMFFFFFLRIDFYHGKVGFSQESLGLNFSLGNPRT